MDKRLSVKDEIEKAKQDLGFTDSQIRLLPDAEGLQVFNTALSQFVASGDRRWWWEDLKHSASRVQIPDSSGFKLLIHITPSAEDKVRFIVEDDQLPFYPVYEANTVTIQAIIGECYFHEYYVIAKDFSWLVCETHHNAILAIGERVEANLRLCSI